MANRYSDYSVSAYKPRSTQELMAFPLMKRKLHDDANEKLQTYLGELNKINPLDKHYNEAQQIKSDLTKQIDEQASQLSKEGFNNNTTSQIFKTNRNIQDMYSPTGKVGQINAAKIGYDTASAEYLKSATQLGHSPEVVQANLKAIQDQYNNSPIYDNKGKVTQFAINQLPPKYVDHVARAREFFKDAGITANEIDNLSSRLVEKGDGSGYVLSQGAKSANSSNEKQLQAAVNFLNSEIANPNSEVGKSLKYGFKSPQEAIEDIKRLSPIYKKNSSERGSTSQISNLFDAPKAAKSANDTLDLVGVNLGEGTTNTKNTELAARIKGGGGLGVTGYTKEERDQQGPFNAPLFKVDNKSKATIINDPYYKDIVNGLNRNLPNNKKLSRGSQEEMNAVNSYLDKHKDLTIQNRYVDPFSSQTGLLFANKNLPKDKNAAAQNLLDKVRIGASVMVDAQGNEIAPSDIKKFNYNGDMTPESNVKVFKNPNMNIIPHAGTITNAKGEVVPVYISRNSDDFKTPQYKGAKDINGIKNIILTSPDIYHHVKNVSGFKNHDMKDVEVKYNQNSRTYDVSYKYNDGSKYVPEDHNFTDAELNQWLIDLNQ